MTNNHKYAVGSREIEAIERLDELALYIEISRYQGIIKNHKENILTGAIEQQVGLKYIAEAKERLAIHMVQLNKYGINPEDEETVINWMHACNKFIANLDIVEYMEFTNRRTTCQDLKPFASAEEGKSAFLKEIAIEETAKKSTLKI